MQRHDIESIISALGETFSYKEKDYRGYLVRCGQNLPPQLKINADFMPQNAFFATLLVTNEIIPLVGDEVTDTNEVCWLIDTVTPLYSRGEVQGYYLALRTNQGIINA